MDVNAEIDEKEHQEPWTIDDDSYRFAPKREGDPWQRLLDPVLQKEKIRCDAWKDEVGNLLIFAGLFSAVVTAFIIESYKTLQPDPNLDVISLLSQISSELSKMGNGTSQAITSSTELPSQTFTPTQSAIRVNVFWFLSLILSLTTVLVGIVALQWLREYQAYPGQSARNTVAIHHMRAEGMEKWHVWNILAALPLLLQIALILFFAGVVDFLDALGSKAVAISVTIAITITLLFLIVTTTLPVAQIVYLRFHLMFPFQLKKPPSQCPYKSPQSDLFYAASRTLRKIPTTLLDRLLIPLRYSPWNLMQYRRYRQIKQLLKKPFTGLLDNSKLPIRFHLLYFRIWKTSWINFDLSWLEVRDAYSRCRDKDPRMGGMEIEDAITQFIPVFDVMAAVLDFNASADDIDKFFDIYHCYSDLSNLLTVARINEHGYRDIDIHVLWRRNRHLRSFIPITDFDSQQDDDLIDRLKPDLSDWEGGYTDHTGPTSNAIKILHELNMNKFLKACMYPGVNARLHHEEVRFRIQHYMFGKKTTVGLDIHFPPYLHFGYPGSHESRLTRTAMRRQSILVYQRFFHYICRPDTVIVPEDLHAQSSIWNNLNLLGITLSQEIIESARGDPQPFNPVEDFLSHLIFDLSEATSKVKPGLNLLYAILYASLPVRSIGSTLEERRYTKSGIYDLYKQILSIIQEFMKQPIDMDDPEPDVSIDTILDRTGDPFDILAFITQVSWGASRNGMLSPNIRRGHRITDYTSNQANIFFPDIQVLSTSDDTSTAFNQDSSRDIEQGIS